MRAIHRGVLLLALLGAGLAAVAAPAPGAEAGPGGGEAAALQALEACRESYERQSFDEARELAVRAEEVYRAMLEERPDAVAAHVGIARAQMECRIGAASMMEQMSLMGSIEKHLARVLEIDPEHGEARLLYAALLYNVPPFLGRSDDAISHLEILLGSDDGPRTPDVYLMLGDLYLRGGETEKAVDVWRRGAERFPDSAALRQRLQDAAPSPAQGERQGVESHGQDPATQELGTQDLAARLRARTRAEVGRPEVVGLAAAVVLDGETLLLDAFGLADVENRVPLTTAAVFRLGSISKQLTAAVILELEAEGRLSVDDRLAAWLPAEHRRAAGEVRLHHLLSHTSGLPPEAVEGPDWIAASLAAPRLGRPGERYAYSNLGYGLLGRVAERAGGKPWRELLQETLLTPLGLEHTLLCDRREIIPHRAAGYVWQGDRLLNAAPVRPTPTLFAAGLVCSTVEDLVAWQLALHGGRVLDPARYRRMVTPPAVSAAEGTTYAFGLRVHAPRGRRVIRHSGGISGFLSELAYYPDEELVVAVLTNSQNSDPRTLGFELADLVLGADG